MNVLFREQSGVMAITVRRVSSRARSRCACWRSRSATVSTTVACMTTQMKTVAREFPTNTTSVSTTVTTTNHPEMSENLLHPLIFPIGNNDSSERFYGILFGAVFVGFFLIWVLLITFRKLRFETLEILLTSFWLATSLYGVLCRYKRHIQAQRQQSLALLRSGICETVREGHVPTASGDTTTRATTTTTLSDPPPCYEAETDSRFNTSDNQQPPPYSSATAENPPPVLPLICMPSDCPPYQKAPPVYSK